MGPILCICTGNICRSPMAERLLDKALRDAGIEGIEVHSAGVGAYDGNHASSYSVKALKELGIDLSDHRSKMLTANMLREASLVLVMTKTHKMAIEEDFPDLKSNLDIWLWREFRPSEKQVADPYGADFDSYKVALKAIMEATDDWVKYTKEKLEKLKKGQA